VIVRFAHEMNLSRYHWGGSMDDYGPESPGKYRDMFRHVVRIFRESGAGNALFAFCPNAESVPNPMHDPEAGWNRAARYYPGDEYVDVLGMDGYNWGTTRNFDEHGWDSRWETFEGIFKDIFDELKSLNRDKPLYVFETSSVSRGGDKNLWIREAFASAREWGVNAVVWFHADKEEDWRLIRFKESRYYFEVKKMMEGGR
jgi:beta-mannanase